MNVHPNKNIYAPDGGRNPVSALDTCAARPTPYRKITHDTTKARNRSKYTSFEEFKRQYEGSVFRNFFGRASETTPNRVSVVIGSGRRCVREPQRLPNTREWPQQAINRLQQLESSNPSMESFLYLLGRLESQRPSTLNECIDYFYPESGVQSFFYAQELSPFVSTNPFAYQLDPNLLRDGTGDLPLQIGEISMMYGWFILFRMLLCQKNPDVRGVNVPVDIKQIFTRSQDVSVLTEHTKKEIRSRHQYQIDRLNTISRTVAVFQAASKAGLASAASGGDVSDVGVAALGEFANQGTTLVAGLISAELGIPSKYATSIATYIVDGAIHPEKYRALLEEAYSLDEKAYEAYNLLKDKIKNQFETGVSGVSDRDLGILSRYSGVDTLATILGTKTLDESLWSQLQSELSGLRSDDENLYERALDWVQKSVTEYNENKYFGSYFEPRSNPLLIAAAGAALTFVFGGIRNEIAEGYEQVGDSTEAALRYFQSHTKSLDESMLKGLPFDFTFMDHVASGWSGFEDATCELQQGGQMLDYWTNVFSGFRDSIAKIARAESNPSDRGGKRYADIMEDCLDAVKNNTIRFDPIYDNSPRILEQCFGLKYLAQNAMRGAYTTITTLPMFSAFTHSFGFSPIYSADTVDGRSAISYLGQNNGPLYVSYGNTYVCLQSTAPDRVDYGGTRQRSSVSDEEVECYLGVSPLPSRRTLEGRFGGRASVTFDVAFGKTHPVMDAQYVALMSVLLCYREARDTIRHSTLPWKSMLPPEPITAQGLSAVALSNVSPSLSRFFGGTFNPQMRFTPEQLNSLSKLQGNRVTSYTFRRLAELTKKIGNLQRLTMQREPLTLSKKLILATISSASVAGLIYFGLKLRSERK